VPLRALRVWQYPSDTILHMGKIELPDARHLDRQVEGELRAFVEETLDVPLNDVITEVGRGPASAALLHAATSDPRMVVVGSRGLGGFKGLRLGSVSQQLCEHSPRPVTVVPSGAPVDPARLDRIVVGVDGSAHAERALRYAGRLAADLGSDLLVVHATEGVRRPRPPGVDAPDEISTGYSDVDEWCAPLREIGTAYEIEVVAGDAPRALTEVARRSDAGLVVVGPRGLGTLGQALIGSVTAALVRQGNLPVTVVTSR
jgi:nucleotide-binding universal stress UspA family protein